MNKEDFLKALEELRKQEKKKFTQSVDLIINLTNFNVKKESVNLFINLPYKVKDVKIAAFLNKKSDVVDSITRAEIDKYKDKKEAKKLIRNYDFFISSASLMPVLATSIGRFLGPAGKMPSPQMGIVTSETEDEIKKTLEKFEKIARIKTKEPSIKIVIGKEDMKDEEIAENAIITYNTILNSLPRKKENIKSVMIKFTMSKPIKIKIK